MRQRITQAEWLQIVRRIYPLNGFPHAEMRRYYREGLSPLAAMDTAVARRRKPSHNRHRGTMMDKPQEVALQSLVGEHMLDGVDESTIQVKMWEWSDGMEDANVIRFRLDGKVYTAVEDPSDGYRSMMKSLFVSEDTMKNTFPPVKVVGRYRDTYDYGGTSEILELIDAANGKVVLTVGTENSDDYYPWFKAEWRPANLAVNAGRSSGDGG